MGKPPFSRKLVGADVLSAHVKAKWEIEVLSEGFTPFPKQFIRTAWRIFKGEDAVELVCAVMAIVDFRMPGTQRNAPSLEYLAFTAGMDPERFEKLLVRLDEMGLLSWRRLSESEEGRLAIDLNPLFERIKKETRDAFE